MKSGFLCVFLVLASILSSAQLRYRTVANGNWNNPAIWNTSTGNGVWSPAVSAPDFTAGLIAITNNVTVTVTANITIDQTDVRPGSTLQVLDGVTVTLNDGSGNDLTHYFGATIRLFGESNIAGPGTALLAGDLYVHSINPTGAITSGTGATGNIRTADRIFKASTVVHYAAAQRQYIGNGHSSVVSVVINNPAGVELNNTSSGIVSFEGPVSILAGELLAANDNLQATANIEINGGSLNFSNQTGSTSTHSINTLTLTDGGVSITSIGASANVSVNFNGNVALMNGNITVASGTREVFIRFLGDLIGTGQILCTGSNNTVRVFGTGSISHTSPFAAGSTLKLLVLDRPSANLIIGSTLNITRLDITSGQVELNAGHIFNGPVNIGAGGTLDFSGVALELRSHFSNTYSGGTLQSDHASDFIISNTGVVGALNFVSGNLRSFQLDRGVNISSTTPLSIMSSLNLLRGGFNNAAGLAFLPGASMEVNSNSTFTGAAPTGGPYNLTYSGSSVITGPGAQGNIANLVSNCSGTVTLSAPITVEQDIIVNSGMFLAGNNSVLAGSVTNTGTFVAPSTTLTVTGNITNNGVLSNGNGTVIFDGNGAPQYILGNPIGFYNLTIDENATVNVETQHSCHGVLTVAEGASFDADGSTDSGRLTLMSSGEGPNQNARVAPIPASASVSGEFTVQRFVSAIDNVDRFISSPVANASVAQLQDDLFITGDFDGSSFPCDGCNQHNAPSLNWFDESAGGAFASRYSPTPVPQGTNGEQLVPGRGYALYFWNGESSTLIDLTGPINQGEIDFGTLSHTPSSPADPATDGWHLLGNPYPSAIQWNDGAGWSRTNVDPTVWVWDEAGGVWRSYHLTDGGNLPNGVIASGQGFWVNVFEGGGEMSINEEAKTSLGGSYYREKPLRIDQLVINLTKAGVTDNAYVVLNERATAAFDKGLDSYKLELGIERMSLSLFSEDKRKLSRIVFDSNGLPKEIELSVAANEAGDYALSFEFTGAESLLSEYQLFDRYLNQFVPLSHVYSFSVEVANTSLSDRFVLRRGHAADVVAEGGDIIEYYPNPVTNKLHLEIQSPTVTNVALVNNLGQPVLTLGTEKQAGNAHSEVDVSELPSGIYFLKVTFSDRTATIRKLIKQ